MACNLRKYWQHRIIPALRLQHRSGSCRTSLAVSALRIMRYCLLPSHRRKTVKINAEWLVARRKWLPDAAEIGQHKNMNFSDTPWRQPVEFTLQAFVVTGVNSARSSPPLRGIFPPRGELPSREASSPANILAGQHKPTRFSAAGRGNPAPQVVYGVDVWDIIIRRGKFRPTTLHKNPSQTIIPTHQKSRMFPRPNHPLAK